MLVKLKGVSPRSWNLRMDVSAAGEGTYAILVAGEGLGDDV